MENMDQAEHKRITTRLTAVREVTLIILTILKFRLT